MVRMCVVHPMHNLLLAIGIANHNCFQCGNHMVLFLSHFQDIQHKVSFVTPSDVGCIPTWIASDFAGFTADQNVHTIKDPSCQIP